MAAAARWAATLCLPSTIKRFCALLRSSSRVAHRKPRCAAVFLGAEMEPSRAKVQRKPVHVIAAVCNDRGIGKNGKLPWNLPSEFQYFLNTVTRVSRPGKINMMVWGKLCWYSNPVSMFPMANSMHVVLSETLRTAPDHAHFVCPDFESAIQLAALHPLADLIETIWVMGGTRVYKDGLNHPWCDLIFLTDVKADFDCDVFFPEFDKRIFKKQEKFVGVPTGIQEENGITYEFQVFKKEVVERCGVETKDMPL